MKIVREIPLRLKERFPEQSFELKSQYGHNILEIENKNLVAIFEHLKDEEKFNFLMDIDGVDFVERDKRFDVNYQLFDSRSTRRLQVKLAVAEFEEIPSLSALWKSANWFEREAFDMHGLHFAGHPNLTRLLTHHQFQGHPLRKDYHADDQQSCSEALPIHFLPNTKTLDSELVTLNIGPSHPATHGTLRIMCALDGERIERANVEIGYLHRCFEKMAETHPYNQVIPYTDRLNYCSAPMNNVGYCKAVERLLGVEIPPKAQTMRVILCELSRIIDHIICIGANAVDLGAITGFFHLFTYREKVYSLFEKLCGARLTVSLTRIGGMANEPPEGWFREVLQVCKEIRRGIDDLETLLSGNKIWQERTQGVGAVSVEDAIEWGYTGPCLRAAGVNLDLRKVSPYYGYEQYDFDIPTGSSGDVFDRYQVRVEEMKQSLRIIEQAAKHPPGGDYTVRNKDIVLPEKKDVYGNIEGLMNHFMLITKGLRPEPGEVYDATEAANGELGFHLVSDGSGCPYRLKVRPPCFAIYQSFPERIEGGFVADAIAILGSMNVIAGELDR